MATELVTCVRHGRLERVQELLSEGADVNVVCPMTVRHVEAAGTPEPYLPFEGEAPLYDTHALFEASRSNNAAITDVLLAHDGIDVNLRATKAQLSTLADASARGDIALVRKLLDHPGVDHRAGSNVVDSPLLYALKYGQEVVVEEFISRQLAEFEEEAALKAEAETNGNLVNVTIIHNYFLTKRTLDQMETEEKLERIRFEFDAADVNKNGSLDKAEFLVAAEALGQHLNHEEAAEAMVAMDTNGDGRVEVEELISFWLGEPLA